MPEYASGISGSDAQASGASLTHRKGSTQVLETVNHAVIDEMKYTRSPATAVHPSNAMSVSSWNQSESWRGETVLACGVKTRRSMDEAKQDSTLQQIWSSVITLSTLVVSVDTVESGGLASGQVK